jgi:toxin YoeB
MIALKKMCITDTLLGAARHPEDLLYRQKTNKEIFRRINGLIKEIKRKMFEGIGKPGLLNHALLGNGSRRING